MTTPPLAHARVPVRKPPDAGQIDIEEAIADKGLNMATGNRTATLEERGDDLYQTPVAAIRALIAVENLPFNIWEPACGPGAIVRVLRAAGHTVHATDLVDYGCEGATPRVDFLMETSAPKGVDAIVTNPPFKNADDFVARSIDLVPEVYMLLRVAFLEGLRWYDDGHRNALGLGQHLARVHVFAPRLDMMHREGWEGRKANSGMAFGWFVFLRDHRKTRGAARISWINPRDYA